MGQSLQQRSHHSKVTEAHQLWDVGLPSRSKTGYLGARSPDAQHPLHLPGSLPEVQKPLHPHPVSVELWAGLLPIKNMCVTAVCPMEIVTLRHKVLNLFCDTVFLDNLWKPMDLLSDYFKCMKQNTQYRKRNQLYKLCLLK